ncbi:15630_t:CDS:2 [Entrophospora sp. SA101]|nr:7175_t:CDS:2 [Entrophospora sp. SA101]CAJ0649118.1 15630_t:CDS:2 [Entrophospora sp. SA101]
MAAYYPEVPSYSQQKSMNSFLKTFSEFYPCWYCAEHLRNEMKKYPPKVESKWALGGWLCDMHNIVNDRLGKTLFDCSKIDERWKDGPKDATICNLRPSLINDKAFNNSFQNKSRSESSSKLPE